MRNIKVKEFERKSLVQKLLDVVIACEHLRIEMHDSNVCPNDVSFVVECSTSCLAITKCIVMDGDVPVEMLSACENMLVRNANIWRKTSTARMGTCGLKCEACAQALTRLLQADSITRESLVQQNIRFN